MPSGTMNGGWYASRPPTSTSDGGIDVFVPGKGGQDRAHRGGAHGGHQGPPALPGGRADKPVDIQPLVVPVDGAAGRVPRGAQTRRVIGNNPNRCSSSAHTVMVAAGVIVRSAMVAASPLF